MTTAKKLYDLLAARAAGLGRRLTESEWLQIAEGFLVEAFPAKAPKKMPVSQMTDAEWLTFLEQQPAMEGIDVRRELGKCQFWCNTNKKQCTRRRFQQWLLNPLVERKVGLSGDGKTSRPRIDPNLNVEPEGWYFVALKKWGATAADGLKAKGWKGMDVYYRTEIVRMMI